MEHLASFWEKEELEIAAQPARNSKPGTTLP
jgi:hypothetical protein